MSDPQSPIPSAHDVWQHSRSHRVVVPPTSRDEDDRNAGWWDITFCGGATMKVLLAHEDIHHGSDGVMAFLGTQWVNLKLISMWITRSMPVTE